MNKKFLVVVEAGQTCIEKIVWEPTPEAARARVQRMGWTVIRVEDIEAQIKELITEL